MEKNRSGVRSRRGKRDTEREGDKYTYVWIRVVGWGPQFCMKSRVPVTVETGGGEGTTNGVSCHVA